MVNVSPVDNERAWIGQEIKAGILLMLLLGSSLSSLAQLAKSYYHEDLYSLRPKIEEPADSSFELATHRPKDFFSPTMNVNHKVENVLDSINRFNVTRKFIDGYTIQIYSGQNKEEAMNTKKKMMGESGLNAIIEYNQPKFRVRVGNYYSRLEAQKDLTRLRRLFPNTILVPEKILVR